MKKSQLLMVLVEFISLVGLAACGPTPSIDVSSSNSSNISSSESSSSIIKENSFSSNISDKEQTILVKIINKGSFVKVNYRDNEKLISKIEVRKEDELISVIYQVKIETPFSNEGFNAYIGVNPQSFKIQGLQYLGNLTTHGQDDLFKDNDLGMSGTDGSTFDTVLGSTVTSKAINDAAKLAVNTCRNEYGEPVVPQKETFTISFYLNGGTGTFNDIKVIDGGFCPRPVNDPVRKDYNFIGWFIKGTDKKYDFNQPVTENIELEARWTTEYVFFKGEILKASKVGEDGKVVIPSAINGEPVTALGDSLYKGNTNLKEIVIPSSVTNINFSAFEDCTNLNKFTIESTIIEDGKITKDLTFGTSVFKGCTALKNFEVPERAVTLGSYTFENCTALKEVNFTANIDLSNALFKNCTALTTVNFANEGNFKIGQETFLDNASLTTFKNFNLVTSLDQKALMNCTRIVKLNFGKDFKNFGVQCLKGTTNLRSITVDEQNKDFSVVNNALFNKSQSSLKFVCPSDATIFTFPKKTTSYSNDAFDACINLQGFNVEEGNTKFIARAGLLFEKPSWGTDLNLKLIAPGFKGDIVLEGNERYKSSLKLGLIEGLNSFNVGPKDIDSYFIKVDGALYQSRKNYTTGQYYAEALVFVDKTVNGALIMPNTVTGIKDYALAYSNVTDLVITSELIEGDNKEAIETEENSFSLVKDNFKIYVPEGYYNTYNLKWSVSFNGNPLGLKYLQENPYLTNPTNK